MRLPPYGRQFLARPPSAGPWVAIGPNAWDFASRKPFPVMVLPPGADPDYFNWPVEGASVLLVEWGASDTETLERVALALLRSGAEFVRPIRQSQISMWQLTPSYYRERRND